MSVGGGRGPDPTSWSCALPYDDPDTIQLAHGGGGRLSQRLIDSVFLEAFRNPALEALGDGAVLDLPAGRIAFSTDSFVVSPIFFPGGDIGSLAVHGTVNDLAMCGARPLYLSAGFVLEEGLAFGDLRRVVASMAAAAAAAGVAIVTGDTKVVDRGKGDQVFINTAGIGVIPDGVDIAPRRIEPGDRILVSGLLADHGIAILSVRQGLEFETTLKSDSAALHHLVEVAHAAAGADLHALRDPTRGGVASAVNELATSRGVGMRLHETLLPVGDAVRGACEILGLDPLYVANEGKCLAFVAAERADAVLAAWRAHPLGSNAAIIGEVTEGPAGRVVVRTALGSERILAMLSGEQLPRIC